MTYWCPLCHNKFTDSTARDSHFYGHSWWRRLMWVLCGDYMLKIIKKILYYLVVPLSLAVLCLIPSFVFTVVLFGVLSINVEIYFDIFCAIWMLSAISVMYICKSIKNDMYDPHNAGLVRRPNKLDEAFLRC